MIVQAIVFTGISASGDNTRCIFDRGESSVGASGCARALEFMNNPG
jgi:hypothetical protein